jgi:hypothetical protein
MAVVADNYAYIYFNGKKIGYKAGGWPNNGGTFKITIKPGENTIAIHCGNTGWWNNPAGLLVAARVGGATNLLFSTDSSWKWINSDNFGAGIPVDQQIQKIYSAISANAAIMDSGPTEPGCYVFNQKGCPRYPNYNTLGDSTDVTNNQPAINFSAKKWAVDGWGMYNAQSAQSKGSLSLLSSLLQATINKAKNK